MNYSSTANGNGARSAIGAVIGLAIAAVDHFAFGGEVSPIVIVGLLFSAAAASGMWWGGRAALAVVALWISLPLSHVVKRVLGWPDTLHPNTYASIFALAGFSVVVCALGLGGGVLLRRLVRSGATAARRS